MIKSKLIELIGRKQDHLSEHDVALSVSAILDKMSHQLAEGGRIEIRGFGSFSLHYRAPRQAPHPTTGERLVTQPKYAVHYKPGKELREEINQSASTYPIMEEKESE